jgi:hypothetical protein
MQGVSAKMGDGRSERIGEGHMDSGHRVGVLTTGREVEGGANGSSICCPRSASD